MLVLALWISNGSASSTSVRVKVVCLGDSLTEGYGVRRDEAYPALLQKKFDEKNPGRVEVVNAGISGSTTSSIASRLKWFLKSKPAVLFIAMGANDGLRGLNLAETKKNLQNAVHEAKKAGVLVVLGGMKLPPNYGPVQTQEFNAIFPEIAKREGVSLVPFILEGIGGDPSLNSEDGIHPNAKGHAKMLDLIFPILDREVEKAFSAQQKASS